MSASRRLARLVFNPLIFTQPGNTSFTTHVSSRLRGASPALDILQGRRRWSRHLFMPYFLGIHSRLGQGTKLQQVKNVQAYQAEMVDYTCGFHEKIRQQRLIIDPTEEVVTVSSCTEGIHHPTFTDGPFSEEQMRDIVSALVQQVKSMVGSDERNIIFSFNLPVLKKISADEQRKMFDYIKNHNPEADSEILKAQLVQGLFYNVYLTVGRGLNRTQLRHNSDVEVHVSAKLKVASMDLTYNGYSASLPFNPPVLPAISSSGKVFLVSTEVCLDHAMGCLKDGFPSWVEGFAKNEPEAFLTLLKDPLALQIVSSNSIDIESRHVLTTHVVHADYRDEERGTKSVEGDEIIFNRDETESLAGTSYSVTHSNGQVFSSRLNEEAQAVLQKVKVEQSDVLAKHVARQELLSARRTQGSTARLGLFSQRPSQLVADGMEEKEVEVATLTRK